MVARVMESRRFLLAVALACCAAVFSASGQAPPPNAAGLTGLPTGPSAEIKSFTAEPSSIKAGEKVTLRWVAFNTYSVIIDPDVGTVATRGSRFIKSPSHRSGRNWSGASYHRGSRCTVHCANETPEPLGAA